MSSSKSDESGKDRTPRGADSLSPKQRAFLAAFGECATVSGAAKASGCSTSSHYEWLRNAEYEAAFNEARQFAVYALESEARRRAIEGVRVYRFTPKGFPIRHPDTNEPYFDLKFSDQLLAKLLAVYDPRFGDKQSITHEVEATNPIDDMLAKGYTIEDMLESFEKRLRDYTLIYD